MRAVATLDSRERRVDSPRSTGARSPLRGTQPTCVQTSTAPPVETCVGAWRDVLATRVCGCAERGTRWWSVSPQPLASPTRGNSPPRAESPSTCQEKFVPPSRKPDQSAPRPASATGVDQRPAPGPGSACPGGWISDDGAGSAVCRTPITPLRPVLAARRCWRTSTCGRRSPTSTMSASPSGWCTPAAPPPTGPSSPTAPRRR